MIGTHSPDYNNLIFIPISFPNIVTHHHLDFHKHLHRAGSWTCQATLDPDSTGAVSETPASGSH